MNEAQLLSSLQQHEGLRLKAYQDTEGVWTIGYGRNLQTMVIDQPTASRWMSEDMMTAVSEAKRFPQYLCCDTDARRNAFIEMVYNLGATRLSGFKKMLAAMTAKDWEMVASEAMNSKWAEQVGDRAVTLTTMLRTGQF